MHQPFIRQWGISRLNISYNVDINMNISISDILCAITTNCDNAISQAGVNIYIQSNNKSSWNTNSRKR